jgi:hypothetical protein
MSGTEHRETPMHSHIAFAARPGEHACCRFASAKDRRLLTVALVRDATRRNYKVLYLCPDDDVDAAVRALAQLDGTVTDALARGQMEVKPAVGTYLRDGAFDPERMLDCLREEHAHALGHGYAGLSLTGDMSWAVSDTVAAKALGSYEARLNGLMPGAKPVLLCLYDHSTGRLGSVSKVLLTTHDIDFPPELAPLARHDQLAAARVMPGGTCGWPASWTSGARRSWRRCWTATSTVRSASTSTASPTWTSPGCARSGGARVSR